MNFRVQFQFFRVGTLLFLAGASISPLQNKGFPQLSPLISVRCLSVPGYSSKKIFFISPSSSLSAQLSFTIPGLPFCYSNSPSLSLITCPAHVQFFLLIVLKMSSTLVCSLIHDALLLSLQVFFSPLLFGHFEVFDPELL